MAHLQLKLHLLRSNHVLWLRNARVRSIFASLEKSLVENMRESRQPSQARSVRVKVGVPGRPKTMKKNARYVSDTCECECLELIAYYLTREAYGCGYSELFEE